MIGPAMQAALQYARRNAESRMQRPCVIRPVTGVDSDDNGADVTTYGSPTYDGLCRVRERGGSGGEESAGVSTVVTSRREVHIPWDTPPQPVGSVVFFGGVASYRITEDSDADDLTARRYPVERVTR